MRDKFYSVYRVDHRGESNPYIRVSEFKSSTRKRFFKNFQF